MSAERIGTAIGRFIVDAFCWALSIIVVDFLDAAGVIDNSEIALTGVALWWGIRAYSKPNVSDAHKNSEVQ